jgi:transposase-like protein
MTRAKYCRLHRLSRDSLSGWIKVLVSEETLRAKAEIVREKRIERRRRTGQPLSDNQRSRAVQAFWAMHVEALVWSGMSVRHYAQALRISAQTLRRWRDLIEAEEIAADWRARLHPSARPLISSGASSAAKDRPVEAPLTAPRSTEPVVDRRSNRRSFTDEEKLAMVMESEAPGVSVAAVCRRHDVSTSMVFRWRIQFGFGGEKPAQLATVRVAARGGKAGDAAHLLDNLLPVPSGMAVVDLLDGRRVFAPVGADPAVIRRQVAEREMAP